MISEAIRAGRTRGAQSLCTSRTLSGAMPKFIDQHPMNPLTTDQLRAAQRSPADEFGVTHHDILFSEPENKLYCVLDAPDREAIEKHHAKLGIRCDWIHEVESTRD